MEKMTYVVALNSAIECGVLSEEVVEKLKALREQVSKKSSTERKVNVAKQTENDGYKAVLMGILDGGKAYTISEMMQAHPIFAENGISNQRVSALMRMLIADGLVSRQEVKGKAYFYKA